jgi:hypothetical protein
MKKIFLIVFFLLYPVYANELVLEEYDGLNEAISNSYAYTLEYNNSLSLIAVTSQLYSADDGYYLIPQNFAIRASKQIDVSNWNLKIGILSWSRKNIAFNHKVAYELSLTLYYKDIEFSFSQHTDQYQTSNNFNLTSIYLYKNF